MVVYKNTVPNEYKEILDGVKIPNINFSDEFDVLGVKGDNLQSLIGLSSIYKGKIKLAYADVPYNTGNEDFIYNDTFNTTDSLNYHSDWISWMLPRLIIVRELLSDNGVMVISIDHNEKRNLENLCVDVFGEKNVLTTATVVSNRGGGGRRNKKDLVTTNEYLVVCAKNINLLEYGEGVLNESKDKGKDVKPRSLLAYNAKLVCDRQGQFYPFLIEKGTNKISTISKNEYLLLKKFVNNVCKDYSKTKIYTDDMNNKISEYVKNIEEKYSKTHKVIFPKYGEKWGRWVPTYETILNKNKPYDVLHENNGVINYMEKVKTFQPMKTIMDKTEYGNTQATDVLKKLYGEKTFNTPKSIILMRDIITSFTNDGDIILDWCAGSNSTYHGLVESDKLQNVNRKYIFIQQEEKGCDIFTDHSLSRINKVNDCENICKNIVISNINMIDSEDFYLNTDTNFDKDFYIRTIHSINTVYRTKVFKYENIYKLC